MGRLVIAVLCMLAAYVVFTQHRLVQEQIQELQAESQLLRGQVKALEKYMEIILRGEAK